MPRHGLAEFQEGLEAVAQSALLHQFGCALVGFLAGSRREHQEVPAIAVHVYVPLGRGLAGIPGDGLAGGHPFQQRSEEHTSELQSLMRISYAVFCLKKTKKNKQN